MNFVIVDDEAVICRGLKARIEYLQPQWHAAASFLNAEDALAWNGWSNVDLLITDICLTGASGIDFTQALYQRGIKLQILFISGHLEFEYAKSALHLKAIDYLVKPISDKQILEAFTRVNRNMEELRKQVSVTTFSQYLFMESYLFGGFEIPAPAIQQQRLLPLQSALWTLEVYCTQPPAFPDEIASLFYSPDNGTRYYLFGHYPEIIFLCSSDDQAPHVRDQLRAAAHGVSASALACSFSQLPSLVKKLMGELQAAQNGDSGFSGNYGITIRAAIAYIKSNYAKQIGLHQIASYLYIHPAYLSGQFKRETGYTITDYISNYRILQAKRLLLDSRNKIYWIAEQVGFHNQRYFSQVFKRTVGLTPAQYRAQVLCSNVEALDP